jgi:hypothetical protein
MKRDFDIHQWQASFLKKNNLNESSHTGDVGSLLDRYFLNADLTPDQELEAVDYVKQWAENRLEILQGRYNR